MDIRQVLKSLLADQEEMLTEMRAWRENRHAETKARQDEKMEAIVHSIQSERDGNIQRRFDNVMEWQEIPKEGSAVASLE
jgi:hypothetical protein